MSKESKKVVDKKEKDSESRAKQVTGYYEVDDVIILRDSYLAREGFIRDEDSGLITQDGAAFIASGYHNYMMSALHKHVIAGGLAEIVTCLTNGVAKKNILIPVLHNNHWVTYQILVDGNDTNLLIHDSTNIHQDNNEFRVKIEKLLRNQGKNFEYSYSVAQKIQCNQQGLKNVYCGGYTARASIGLLADPTTDDIWFECDESDDEVLRQQDLQLVNAHAGTAASKFGVQNTDYKEQARISKLKEHQEAKNLGGMVLKDIRQLSEEQKSHLYNFLQTQLDGKSAAEILESVRSLYINFNLLYPDTHNPFRHFFNPNFLPGSINSANDQKSDGLVNSCIPIDNLHSPISILNLLRTVKSFVTPKGIEDKKADQKGDVKDKVESAFLHQINRHYRGMLSKLDSVTDEGLQALLDKTAIAVSALNDDEIIIESEGYVRDRMESILKRNLALKIAKTLLKKAGEKIDVVEYSYSKKDHFSQTLKEIFLTNIEREERATIYDADYNLFGEIEDENWQKYIKNLRDTLAGQDSFDLELFYETMDIRLKLYGQRLIAIEQEEIEAAEERRRWKDRRREEAYENYLEQKQEAEENPESLEWDYDGQILPKDESRQYELSEEDFVEEFYTEHEEEFSDPADFRNLLAITSGFKKNGLSWLVNQIAEYEEEEMWDHIQQRIVEDPEMSESMDDDLLKFIIYSATVSNSDDETKQLFNSGPLARNYDDEELIAGIGFITKSIRNYLKELHLETLKKNVRDKFAYVKEIQEKGWLEEFEKEYNNAANRNDLVKQNQLWSIFDLLQKDLTIKKSDEKPSKKRIASSIETAKRKYEERAAEYYFRIYPQHETDRVIYSSKKPEKIAAIEMDQILGELQDIGDQIKDVLVGNKKKETTNVVTPVLCFVVSNRPHKVEKEDRDHGRIIIPISFDLDLEKYLLSKDEDDGVVSVSDSNFFRKTKEDSKAGMDKVKVKSSAASQNSSPTSQENELLAHSERVMFEALRNRNNVRKLVGILYEELQKLYQDEINPEDRFKVYSVALLAYSTNSVCQLCSPAIIAHENYSKDSFLTILTQELIRFEKEDKSRLFKIRGENLVSTELKADEEIPQEIRNKFHLTTIVSSTKPFTTQSEDMCAEERKNFQNPQAKIYLENDAIDLHKHEKNSAGNEISDNYSFYEFSRSNFKDHSRSETEGGIDFQFVGKSFMSGSKISKISSDEKRSGLDEEVSKIIKAREVIKLCNVQNKGKFTNR